MIDERNLPIRCIGNADLDLGATDGYLFHLSRTDPFRTNPDEHPDEPLSCLMSDKNSVVSPFSTRPSSKSVATG
jgi:hypothetical protein